MAVLKKIFVVFLLSGICTTLLWQHGHKIPNFVEFPKVEENWWAKTAKKDGVQDEKVYPYTISVSSEVLSDLTVRLKNARITPPLQSTNFEYGFNTIYLEQVISYWRNQYDWKKAEKTLNQYQHFKTKIDGISVHFLRVKPKDVPKGVKVIPLLLVHGWPGSVFEFYNILPLLTTPSGNNQSIVFEVICPSIPGFGFSEAPYRPGFGVVAASHTFHKLMQRLGFSIYYVQGGDFGSPIAKTMALYYPNNVLGIHINMPSVETTGQWLKVLIGQIYPSFFFTKQDIKKIYPIKDRMLFLLKESGYFHIQATKPDTVGVGLNDSPMGLAAYILEKFSTLVNPGYVNLKDGGLTKKLNLDQLLTNVMIYWVTGSITTSVRFYKEAINDLNWRIAGKFFIDVPTGIAAFPHEIQCLPETLAGHQYSNLVQYTDMPRGGHFAALEEPQLLSDDIFSFVGKVEKLKSGNKNQ